MKHLVNTGPQTVHPLDTRAMMLTVLAGLVPAVLFSVYLFGHRALLVYLVCAGTAVLAEYACQKARKTRVLISDGSALLTGVLLAMCLPPGIALWMSALGAVFAIVAGKVIFGGLGSNIFNPALLGRVFLAAAFPAALTTWRLPWPGPAGADALTGATPLGQAQFDRTYASARDLFLGVTGGSLGETSALLLLLGGLFILFRRAADWRIPLSYLLTVFLLGALLHAARPETYYPPMFHLLSGGLMLGALFMATDPVTSPVTVRGRWIFGLGCGLFTVLIRLFGSMPEGVAQSILFMNALTPLINRGTRGRVFGAAKGK